MRWHRRIDWLCFAVSLTTVIAGGFAVVGLSLLATVDLADAMARALARFVVALEQARGI